MKILQQFPAQPALEFSVNSPDEDSRFTDFLEESYRPPAGQFIRGNIVLSKNGSLSDDQGVSAGISSPLDRQILRLIRQFAEVVIHGASTLRAEGLIIPKTAKLAILTSTGSFDLVPHPLSQQRVYIFCAEAAYEQCRQRYGDVVAGMYPVSNNLSEASVDVVAQLLRLGYQSLVCEGGAQILDAFIQQQLIDELAVTHSPVSSSRMVRLIQWPNLNYQLKQQFESSDSFVFQRWQNPNAITKTLNANTATMS